MISINNYQQFEIKDPHFFNFISLIKNNSLKEFILLTKKDSKSVFLYNNFLIKFALYKKSNDFILFLIQNYYKNNSDYEELFEYLFLNTICFKDSILLEYLIQYIYNNDLSKLKITLKSKAIRLDFNNLNLNNIKIIKKHGFIIPEYLIPTFLRYYYNDNNSFSYILNLKESKYFFTNRLEHFFMQEEYYPIKLNNNILNLIINNENFSEKNYNYLSNLIYSEGNYELWEILLKNNQHSMNSDNLVFVFLSQNKQYKNRIKILKLLINMYDIQKKLKEKNINISLINNQELINLIINKENINNF
jgi:hypothetical protein